MTAGASGNAPERGGALAANVMRFARVLRRAGLPIGPGQIAVAQRALTRVRVADRAEFYWALHGALVSDHRQNALFDQAFGLFWRVPRGMDAGLVERAPRGDGPARAREVSRRVAEALWPGASWPPAAREVRRDAALAYSEQEALRRKDFGQMSVEELRRARQLVARLRLPVAQVPTRRFRPDPRGSRVDPGATLRASIRAGTGAIPLRWRAVRRRPPPLVALCDISGSMERYAHIVLRFLHALTGHRDRVRSFVFGTRLTNITRALRARDIDLALARVGTLVRDWSSGTRIGACLETFNRQWSRRVLGQGAVVLLISDGLDRDAARGLSVQMERLHKSCRRLIWLNPLLRYQGFEPRAAGIRAMLPHVDELRPVHDLDSLAALAAALHADR